MIFPRWYYKFYSFDYVPLFLYYFPIMTTSSKKSSQGKNKAGKMSSKRTSEKAVSKAASKSASKGSASKNTAADKKAPQKKPLRASTTSKAVKSTTAAKKTTGAARRRKLRYKKGQEIVYPLQGSKREPSATPSFCTTSYTWKSRT